MAEPDPQMSAREAAAAERSEQAIQADVSELMLPVLHEINNFLNTLMLQAALLEQRDPVSSRDWCAEVRRQTKNITALVQHLQQYKRRPRPAATPVDLNRLVRETVAEVNEEHSTPARVNLELAPDLPLLPKSTTDLKRLCRFLLTNAIRAVGPAGGTIIVRTRMAADAIQLSFEDSGPSLAADLLPHFFDPMFASRDGTDRLELAACKSLARRLQAKTEVTNGIKQGVIVSVDIPVS